MMSLAVLLVKISSGLYTSIYMIIINVEGNGSYWTQLPNGANNFQSTNQVHLELSVYLYYINDKIIVIIEGRLP
jgi:hypothetical protein